MNGYDANEWEWLLLNGTVLNDKEYDGRDGSDTDWQMTITPTQLACFALPGGGTAGSTSLEAFEALGAWPRCGVHCTHW